MPNLTDNVKVSSSRLVKPVELIETVPVSAAANNFISHARDSIADIIESRDKRLLVIVGPCSIHDVNAALEYATLLSEVAQQYAEELLIVMRIYLEKPRTTVGWGGFISDPELNGTFDINLGLSLSRKLLRDVIQMHLPTATEFLDPSVPAFLNDLICWSAIGARTVESQIHRQLASGLSMPVGFKNTTDGNIKIAIDAVKAARHSHCVIGLSRDGEPTIIKTKGNQHGHIILRGSGNGPNYSALSVKSTSRMLQEENVSSRIMIDCSHGNSLKNYNHQSIVIDSVIEQLENGEQAICGVMLESHLLSGSQPLEGNNLIYGQSITDGCLSFAATLPLLEKLAQSARRRK